jgi:peptidoglycan-N-acetylglucosamine deacetylase
MDMKLKLNKMLIVISISVFLLTILVNKTYGYNEMSKSEVVFNEETTKKYVALTFDDGPNGENTYELLSLLKANNAKATFFMLGSKMEGQEGIILDLLDDENEIGYHSYSHKNMARQTKEEIEQEYISTDKIYYNITKKHLLLKRPPYGIIGQNVRKAFDGPYILWSIDTNDWRYRSSKRIYNYVLSKINDGDVILFHDTYKSTIEAIKNLLPKLKEEGYQFVTISNLANIKNYTLEKYEIYHSFD